MAKKKKRDEGTVLVTEDAIIHRHLAHGEPCHLDRTDLDILKESNIDSAMRQLEIVDEVIAPDFKKREEEGAPAPVAGGIPLTLDQLRNLGSQAIDGMAEYNRMADRLMTRDLAVFVRGLRVEEGFSWRAISRECAKFGFWPETLPAHGSNQLVGMALCDYAARRFLEDYREPPWNVFPEDDRGAGKS